jgi:hypothetical protein
MRPMPPDDLLEETGLPIFAPAHELRDWAFEQFIDDASPIANEDHRHLAFARLGMLWTNVANGRAGRRIIGQCEMGLPPTGKWLRARIERQLIDWFGDVPDFVLTFDAGYCATCGDAELMALVEHELYHAGQARDIYGLPKFRRDGSPAYALRGHDVEEFVGVVRRYGAEAAGVSALMDAAAARPLIASAHIAEACGNCLARAA